ncbi:MAG TPA: hypothetical protein VE954_12690 [Oligoflexus sp.]|uniref:hypothetical protein n=1 Tax=Oligoflexus sp. TaxID=1971216 RepID=UPI002D363652|nr:hypothetical protein [Oligoflexus sp.]HYX33965.1 hypothetical protein [Oligoflexus sp.]
MKKCVTAGLFVVLSSSAFGQGPIVKRGSFEQIVDNKGVTVGFKLRDFQDNTQLIEADAKVGDIVQEVCKIKLTSIAEYRNADGLLQTSDKCSIKVIRDGKALTLNTDG